MRLGSPRLKVSTTIVGSTEQVFNQDGYHSVRYENFVFLNFDGRMGPFDFLKQSYISLRDASR
jgi:hypothetical protein